MEAQDLTIKIYLTNLAKYNAGRLVGKWVELPADDLENHLKEILGNDEEYFITDYEAPFEIDEYENIIKLNEFVEEFENLEDHEKKIVCYLIDIGYKREEALESHEDVIFYENMTMKDLAYDRVDSGFYGDINPNLERFIDYDAIAREMDTEGYVETDDGIFLTQ